MKCTCGGKFVNRGTHYRCDRCGDTTTQPSIGTIQDWDNEGGCETPCGCWVEMDGTCEHGNSSWAILMGLI